MMRAGWLAAAAALAVASPKASVLGAQQSLSSRIDAVRDGSVELRFATRPDVCGDGLGSIWTARSGDGGWNGTGRACIHGPVVVTIARADGQIASVRSCVAGTRRTASPPTADLGEVPPAEGARYLLAIARTLGGSSAGAAVSAAAFADDVDLSADLTRLVRDDDATMAARKDALFWFGQSDAPTRALIDLYGGLRSSTLRDQYTFVLSQRRDDDAAIAKLIDVAQHDADGHVRKQAMFWLGQSGSPRAVAFFHSILMR